MGSLWGILPRVTLGEVFLEEVVSELSIKMNGHWTKRKRKGTLGREDSISKTRMVFWGQ